MSNNPLDTSERPTCETCVFWFSMLPIDERGDCRVHAPTAVVTDDDTLNAIWPETEFHEGCGEHHDFKRWLTDKQERR